MGMDLASTGHDWVRRDSRMTRWVTGAGRPGPGFPFISIEPTRLTPSRRTNGKIALLCPGHRSSARAAKPIEFSRPSPDPMPSDPTPPAQARARPRVRRPLLGRRRGAHRSRCSRASRRRPIADSPRASPRRARIPARLDRKAESALLIAIGPHLEDFLAALFGIERRRARARGAPPRARAALRGEAPVRPAQGDERASRRMRRPRLRRPALRRATRSARSARRGHANSHSPTR